MKLNRTKDCDSGSLVIEAMLALVAFMFLFFIFLSFGQYTKTQNAVKHALNQTLLTMSMVNNQRTQEQALINNAFGIDAQDITDFIALFDSGAAQNVAVNLGQPYSAKSKDVGKTDFYEYSSSALELDALKYFTYYMCIDKTWDEINGMDENALKDILKQSNIKEIAFNRPEEKSLITGANSTGYIEKKGSANVITISITYTIDSPFSFTGFFISDPEKAKGPEFTDSQSFVLID